MATSELNTPAEADADALDVAHKWRSEGKQVALATVVGTWGSSPRPVGSQLVIAGTGDFQGSVSGGCIEGAVVQEALAVIADGKPRLLSYGVTNEMAWEVGLACGGKVEVFVERVE
jgi:xanthine/CO dehydrogenase XdhC/CoxF family maturation factor